MATEAEVEAMRLALSLASHPANPLGPNPRVGAVILRPEGEVVAEGAHRGRGTPHAEVAALQHVDGDRARGATAVVTLEPCDHVGRTGPCSVALIDAGIARVVYAQADQSPVAAGGVERLRAAGVDVEGGVLADEAAALNPEWTFAQRHRRPFVTWKFAATLDGRWAAADGTSRWVSGPESRLDTHVERARCDVVLVGTGTILVDNPRLTVRDENDQAFPRESQPLRAVMGEREIPASAAVLDAAADTLALRTRDPGEALDELYGLGNQHVWLEGGPTLAAAFVRAGLVDRVIAYVAPMLLGAGRSAVGDLGIETVADALRLVVVGVDRLGDDVRLTLEPSSQPSSQLSKGSA
jgi:diaminohydroxyphosphoribosylaminopyrimidine deaminase/5-amino-6-(5-phosphoribosylamino)uracil reductase